MDKVAKRKNDIAKVVSEISGVTTDKIRVRLENDGIFLSAEIVTAMQLSDDARTSIGPELLKRGFIDGWGPERCPCVEFQVSASLEIGPDVRW